MINHPADPGGDMVEPPDAPNGLRIPFIFVPRGDPLPTQWIAEHPDWFTVPAVMVPRNPDNSRRPWAEVQALPRQTDAAWGTLPNPPGGMAAPGIPGSFAPPPAREKRMRDGQPWPKDRNGGDGPADRWGRPTRPLWDYPPGMRAPGEPGSVSEAEAIASARVALATLDPANLRAILASGRTGAGMDGTQTPARGVASRYPGAYDVAEAGEGVVAPAGQPVPASDRKPPAALELRGKASFCDPPPGTPTALPGGFNRDVYDAAMFGRPGFRLGDVVRVQLQDDPTRFVVVRVNDTGPFALDAREKLVRPLRPNPDRVIDLTPAAMEALVGPNYVDIGLVHVTVIKLPVGSHEGKKESQ